MDVQARRETYRGFGDAYTRAFELVLTPLLFGGFGWLVDSALGTGPVLTLVLGLVAVSGLFVRAYYRYAAEMRAHEARLPGRPPVGVAP